MQESFEIAALIQLTKVLPAHGRTVPLNPQFRLLGFIETRLRLLQQRPDLLDKAARLYAHEVPCRRNDARPRPALPRGPANTHIPLP